jgi:hypothetical protein
MATNNEFVSIFRVSIEIALQEQAMNVINIHLK